MHYASILLIGMAAAAAPGAPESYSFEVGSPFPTVSLPSIEDGGPLSVEKFRGKKLVLHLWASW